MRRGGEPWRKPVGFKRLKCPVCGDVVPDIIHHANEMVERGKEDPMLDGHLALSVMGS